jgi:hypothetical protein
MAAGRDFGDLAWQRPGQALWRPAEPGHLGTLNISDIVDERPGNERGLVYGSWLEMVEIDILRD